MTVDEILAAGWYTDRRGRKWRRLPLSGRWADQVIDHQGIHWAGQKIEADQMRLLIERDQHRDACEGLQECGYHPVPFVEIFRRLRPPYHVDYQVVDTSVEPDFNQGLYRTLPEALDAARALAVGE